MDFNDLNEIKNAGFEGFKTIKELMEDSLLLPDKMGVYLILNLDDKHSPSFLEIGSGGYFKSKNPNVAVDVLKDKWIENTLTLYIGKTGGSNKRTLKNRLAELLQFSQGVDIGHWGGRYLWQLKNSQNLVVCWKPLFEDNPEDIKKDFITKFKAQYNGRKPFANLRD